MIMQGTIFSTCFFHFMVNDQDGWIGTLLRSICGQLDEREVRSVVAFLWIIASVGQVLLNSCIVLYCIYL